MANTRSGEPIAITDLLTTRQTAKRLNRTVRTVARMVGDDRLHAERVPGYKGPLLFHPDEVERVRRELAGDAPPTSDTA